MRYAGTISIPVPAFEAMLEGAARSLRRARLVATSSCSATTAATAPASSAWRRKLNREWAGARPPRCTALPEYYRAAQADFARLLEGAGLQPPPRSAAMPAWPTPR